MIETFFIIVFGLIAGPIIGTMLRPDFRLSDYRFSETELFYLKMAGNIVLIIGCFSVLLFLKHG